MAVSMANPITVSTSMARNTVPQQQPVSILSITLSQPQQARIASSADGQQQQHITMSKKPLIKVPLANVVPNSTVTAPNTSANAQLSSSAANSTAAIQNILQTSLQSGGSILSATLSQPPAMPKQSSTKLLQTQLTSNNAYRRSKSTDEVPAFLKVKETPAQIVSKRHSSMEAPNTIKEEKDDAILASLIATVSVTSAGVAAAVAIIQKTSVEPITAMAIATQATTSTTPSAEKCKYTTVTIHKSDESQNVLLKQLLQQASNTAPPPSSLPTISRTVTTLHAPRLGAVSSLEAQLARPVILPVPSKPNAFPTGTNAFIFFSFLEFNPNILSMFFFVFSCYNHYAAIVWFANQ